MTPDQIRQIAEEFARTQMDDLDQGYWDEERLSDRAYNSILDTYTEAVIPIVQFLTERYCVVERSKVVEMYECIAQNIQASHKLGLNHAEDIARGSCATMRDIFGSETFNKNEDD